MTDYPSSAIINHMVNQESITKQTARKLREALKAADRSVRWLSNQSGTPYVTLTRQLKGQSTIGIGQVATYAECLNLTPMDILPDFFSPSAANKPSDLEVTA